MTLDETITEILRKEGWPKVTDHAFDKGGLTKGGVTYKHYNRWLVGRGAPPLTTAEFVELPETAARLFFADAFAGPFRFVADPKLFDFLADWSVNAGPDDPARALQRFLTAWGSPCGAIDGVVGPKTRAAWDAFLEAKPNLAKVMYELVMARYRFHCDEAFDVEFRAFLKAHPKHPAHNIRGWLNRTFSFLNPDEA